MKKMLIYRRLLFILTIIIFIVVAFNLYSGQKGIIDRIKQADTPLNNDHDQRSYPIPKQTVLVKMKYQGGPFWTETRKDKIERYPCQACHNNNQTIQTTQTKELAHNDIKLDHGGNSKSMSCLTCHYKNNRDMLVKADTTIDMDHSYEMCQQCHFRQQQDWVGGAHGKRVSYWAGQRVVKNCTGCHNPHSPRFEKRWPATYSPPSTQ